MGTLDFDDMQKMQRQLHEKYLEKWGPLSPQLGRELLLWMMGEAGEVGDIIKKNGDASIVEDEKIHHDFVEEMCDVLMYFNDVMLCYSISPEELAKTYGKSLKNTIAVGDYYNDAEMLCRAGIGVAMGNAPEAVKSAADRVTGRCEDNGVAELIDWLMAHCGEL